MIIITIIMIFIPIMIIITIIMIFITIMIIITIINMLVILRTTSTDPSPSASSGWARETSRTPRLVRGRGARRVNSS